MAAILPHIFHFNNITITPEKMSNDKPRSDLVVSQIDLIRDDACPFGSATPLVMIE